MLPLYHDPYFTFRFADDRIIPWRTSEADARAALAKDIEEHGERSRFLFAGNDELALRS
jgi:hypothetical protein